MEPILSHPWYKESQLASCRVKTNNKSVSVYSKISDVNVFEEMPLKDDLKPNFLPDSNWKKKQKKNSWATSCVFNKATEPTHIFQWA